MPVLAGRVLALGRVDAIGVLLAGSVLLWIPSHILTLAIRYADDYDRAGVPMWPNLCGPRATRLFIATANLLNTLVLTAAGTMLRIHPIPLLLLLGASLGMLTLSALQLVAPTERRNWVLFKAASLYMLASSLLLTLGSLV
jgi:protoheme IX farnesyltransferase